MQATRATTIPSLLATCLPRMFQRLSFGWTKAAEIRDRALPMRLLAASAFLCLTAAAAPRPNVVVILADDLGWQDVGFHGSKIRTPHLDALAAGGSRLDQFYAQPTCSPTRTALMTGRYPFRSGSHRMVWRPWHEGGVPLDERFLSQALQETGYVTAIAGKWHLGMANKPYTPLARGFTHQYGHLGGHLDYFKHTYYDGLDWHRDETELREQGYSTDLIANESIRIINATPNDQPLFLYVAFNAPHAPLQAPADAIAQYADVFPNKNRRTFAAMVTSMDTAIGRIVQALDDTDKRRNTLIFFSSDNGGAEHFSADNGPLRAGKGTEYEGGVRVPALVNWPAVVPAGRIVKAPLHIVDLFPTIANLAGASTKQPLPLDGRDAWPAITQNAPSPHDEIVLNAVAGVRGAIRVGDWKLVFNGNHKSSKPTDPDVFELFNVADDPFETNDLANQHPERVTDLHNRLKAHFKQQGKNPGFTKKPDNWQPKSYWQPNTP